MKVRLAARVLDYFRDIIPPLYEELIEKREARKMDKKILANGRPHRLSVRTEDVDPRTLRAR